MFAIRRYDPDVERADLLRVWKETGWFPRSDDAKVNTMADFAGETDTWVGTLNETIEAIVVNTNGQVLYDREDLPFTGVMTVAVGRPARKMGVAGKITAHAVSEAARGGAAVVGLGCFEQGYYDRLGFGTGAYRTWVSFDPTTLKTRVKARVPRRISPDEWPALHAARRQRRRVHGGLNLDLPITGRTGLVPVSHPVILGYDDGPDGALSHYVVMGNAPNPDAGPYEVLYLCWETAAQFDELIALLRAQGDQMRGMTVLEPPGVQWQDLLTEPHRHFMITAGSGFAGGIRSIGDRQLRIVDLERCIAGVKHSGPAVDFVLELTDPIERFFDASDPWRGIGGVYTVSLSEESRVCEGSDAGLPVLRASVGAFSRMWFGVKPASGLALTDDLDGAPTLIQDLDRVFRLPAPEFDWFI
jgi:hypothetical protein